MSKTTPKDTYEQIALAGATDYSWYGQVRTSTGNGGKDARHEGWSMDIVMEDGEEGSASRVVGHTEVMDSARILADHRRRPQYSSDSVCEQARLLLEHPDEADFDAGTADELLQIAVLGEIVFG